jgi:hypothetical protein
MLINEYCWISEFKVSYSINYYLWETFHLGETWAGKKTLAQNVENLLIFIPTERNSGAICNRDWKVSQSANGTARCPCSNWTGKGMQQFGTWLRKTWEKFNNDWDKTITFSFISPFWTSYGSNTPSNMLLHFNQTTPPPLPSERTTFFTLAFVKP